MIDEETKRKLIEALKEAPDMPNPEHEPIRFDYYIKLYHYALLKDGNTSS